MSDYSLPRTKERILNYLRRVPTGVPRGHLHAVTGDKATIHQAVADLIAEGLVHERIYRGVRGKPRREYVLAEHWTPAAAPQPAGGGAELPPGAEELLLHVVRAHPGTSRAEMWTRAVTRKAWVAGALDQLCAQGRIREVLVEDARGGLIRKYFPADAADAQAAPPEEALAGAR